VEAPALHPCKIAAHHTFISLRPIGNTFLMSNKGPPRCPRGMLGHGHHSTGYLATQMSGAISIVAKFSP
jgi:hypothetical protein